MLFPGKCSWDKHPSADAGSGLQQGRLICHHLHRGLLSEPAGGPGAGMLFPAETEARPFQPSASWPVAGCSCLQGVAGLLAAPFEGHSGETPLPTISQESKWTWLSCALPSTLFGVLPFPRLEVILVLPCAWPLRDHGCLLSPSPSHLFVGP